MHGKVGLVLLLLIELARLSAGTQSISRKLHGSKVVVQAGFGDEQRVHAQVRSSHSIGHQQQAPSTSRMVRTGLSGHPSVDQEKTLLRIRELPPKKRIKALVDAAFRSALALDSSPQTVLETGQSELPPEVTAPEDAGPHIPPPRDSSNPLDEPDKQDQPIEPCTDNPLGKYVCDMLHGNNIQVMKRIEHIIEVWNIGEPTTEKIEMEYKDEDKHLVGMKDDLWQLWWCSNRAKEGVPCNPKNPVEPEVKAARDSAIAHYTAIAEEASEIGAQASKEILDGLEAASQGEPELGQN